MTPAAIAHLRTQLTRYAELLTHDHAAYDAVLYTCQLSLRGTHYLLQGGSASEIATWSYQAESWLGIVTYSQAA